MSIFEVFTASGRRRRRVRQALTLDRVPPDVFESLTTELLAPPALAEEDLELFHHLLQASIKGIGAGWTSQHLKTLDLALATLGKDPNFTFDLAGLYHQFALRSDELGNRVLACDAARRGYLTTRKEAASRAECVLFLVTREQFNEPAKQVYHSFVNENPPASPQGQRFFRAFAERGQIASETHPSQVPQRMPYNLFLVELLGQQAPLSARINAGLGYLILGDLEHSNATFREVLAIKPGDKLAAQGLVLAAYRQKRYSAGLELVSSLRRAGVSGREMEALEALGQAGSWLTSIQAENAPAADTVRAWYAALKAGFDLQGLVQVDVCYLKGRLAGILGELPAALEGLAEARRLDRQHLPALYGSVHLLQIAGKWAEAATALKTTPETPELLCLRLRQELHDRGVDDIPAALLKRAGDPAAQEAGARLVGAQWAVIAGRAETVPPWPEGLALATAEQADVWSACWIAARLAGGATAEAQQALTRPTLSRLPKPERSVLVALAHWAAKDHTAATEHLNQALASAPDYDAALRLSVVLAESRADPARAKKDLTALLRVCPNDYRAALQLALLDARQERLDDGINRLRTLLARPSVTMQASFWLGRLLLIRGATKRTAEAERDLALAAEQLGLAEAAGHSQAAPYRWLCQARRQLNGKEWSKSAAQALMKEFRRIPGAEKNEEVARTAALVAVCSGQRREMLWGTDLLVSWLAGCEKGAKALAPTLQNLEEALWRIDSTLASGSSESASRDGLTLAGLSRRLEAKYPEHARIARRISDRILLADVINSIQAGRNPAGTLEQVKEILKEDPHNLLANLARLSILKQKGDLSEAEVTAEIRSARRSDIAAALKERVLLADGSTDIAQCPLGTAAFLTTQPRGDANMMRAINVLKDRAAAGTEPNALVEMARCMAALDRVGDAMKLYDRALELHPTQGLADEYCTYLCHVAAHWKAPRAQGQGLGLEKTRSLLAKAAALASKTLPVEPAEQSVAQETSAQAPAQAFVVPLEHGPAPAPIPAPAPAEKAQQEPPSKPPKKPHNQPSAGASLAAAPEPRAQAEVTQPKPPKELIDGPALAEADIQAPPDQPAREQLLAQIAGIAEEPIIELLNVLDARAAQVEQAAQEMTRTAAPATLPEPAKAAISAESVVRPAEFDVILQAIGPRKIGVIKAVMTLTNLRLSPAKELVESAPVLVLQGVSQETATFAKFTLEAEGATVDVKVQPLPGSKASANSSGRTSRI